MADVFIEHMVKRKSDGKSMLIKCGLVLGVFVAMLIPFVVMLLLPEFVSIGLMVAVFIVWGIIILFRRLNLEYEYILTNGELDIDKIMGRARRKRLLSVDCKKFDIFAPMNEANAREYESQTIRKRLDYSSHPGSEKRYYALYNDKDGARTLLVIEPNEAMLSALSKVLRNKFKA